MFNVSVHAIFRYIMFNVTVYAIFRYIMFNVSVHAIFRYIMINMPARAIFRYIMFNVSVHAIFRYKMFNVPVHAIFRYIMFNVPVHAMATMTTVQNWFSNSSFLSLVLGVGKKNFVLNVHAFYLQWELITKTSPFVILCNKDFFNFHFSGITSIRKSSDMEMK